MGFNLFVPERLQDNETRSVNDFAGIAGDGGFCEFPDTGADPSATSLNAGVEERLADRRRIAQELHDTLLRGFFSVSMHLHEAVEHLAPECAFASQRFGDILQLLDRVLEQGRCAVQGLRSPNEGISSLGEAFAGIPNDLGFAPWDGFRVVIHGRERKLRAGLRDEVYRIGREAIINACRHSQAKDIEAEVRYRPTELRIAVRDNGCGIDPKDLRWGRTGHWGLQGMRERADRIGARLRLWSSVALGTEVELCVPGRVAFEPGGGRVSA